jgi:hypothetical protein
MSHESIDDSDSSPSVSSAGLWGSLKLVALILAAIAALLLLSAAGSSWFKLDFDATYWIAAGAIILALTLIRPWWFWNHPYAALVRSLLTDRGAIVLYLALAGIVTITGVRRQLAIARARNECIRLLAAAHTTHDRVQALYSNGVTHLPHNDAEPQAFSCERLLESK